MNNKKIVIVSSYNCCHAFYTGRLPKMGEAVAGYRYDSFGAGKGTNQAIAASRTGGQVGVILCVGDDAYGRKAREVYELNGVDCRYMKVHSAEPTGSIGIFYGDNGHNQMVSVPGANACLAPEDIDKAEELIRSSAIAGFQFETNRATVAYAIKKACGLGLKTVLDPAPALPLDDDLYPYIAFIKPNEFEASILSGIQVRDVDSAFRAGETFLERGVREGAVITLGGEGCVFVTREKKMYFRAPDVKPVETIRAGDSFMGSFMAKLAEEKPIEQAIAYASCAAALVITKKGRMVDVFPSRKEVESLYQRYMTDRDSNIKYEFSDTGNRNRT